MCPRKGSSEVGVGEKSLDLLKLASLGWGPSQMGDMTWTAPGLATSDRHT